jgi:hypothetical protein
MKTTHNVALNFHPIFISLKPLFGRQLKQRQNQDQGSAVFIYLIPPPYPSSFPCPALGHELGPNGA